MSLKLLVYPIPPQLILTSKVSHKISTTCHRLQGPSQAFLLGPSQAFLPEHTQAYLRPLGFNLAYLCRLGHSQAFHHLQCLNKAYLHHPGAKDPFRQYHNLTFRVHLPLVWLKATNPRPEAYVRHRHSRGCRSGLTLHPPQPLDRTPLPWACQHRRRRALASANPRPFRPSLSLSTT